LKADKTLDDIDPAILSDEAYDIAYYAEALAPIGISNPLQAALSFCTKITTGSWFEHQFILVKTKKFTILFEFCNDSKVTLTVDSKSLLNDRLRKCRKIENRYVSQNVEYYYERARGFVGRKYDVLTNNCQHLVNALY